MKSKIKIACLGIVIIAISIFLGYKLIKSNKVKSIEIKVNEISIGDNENINNENPEFIDESIVGYLTIPKILIENEIVKEGVDLNTLSSAIGHFNNTSIYQGNIGLASHNRGGKADYFKNLKKLEIGDLIYYKTKYGNRRYMVKTIEQIESTNWCYLESTTDNRITLITCISNKPNLRLCVHAIEI